MQGHLIWSAFRAAEQRDASARDLVLALYRRELSVPLSTTDATLAEFLQVGYAAQDAAPVQAVAAKTQGAVSARMSLETPLQAGDVDPAVLAARGFDASLLAAYMALVAHEQREGNPGRVMTAFERAISEFPFTVGLWQRYTSYLATTVGGAVTAAAFDRATRTCPWAGDLWAASMRLAERRSDAPRLQALYTAACAAPLQTADDHTVVGLARMDAGRRGGDLEAVRLAAQAALDGADAVSGSSGHVDCTLRVAGGWALYEAAASAAAGRGVWEALLKRSAYNGAAETWLAYAAHERCHGSVQDARKVFKRCFARKLDCAAGVPPAGASSGQEAVCHAWLRLERELGTADDYAAAEAKVAPVLEALETARAAAAAEAAAASRPKEPARKLTPDEMRRMRREKDPNFKAPAAEAPAAKRRAAPGGDAVQSAPKRSRSDEAGAVDAPAAQPPALQGDVDSQAAAVRRGPELTAFVRNVPVDATPEQVRALFADAGLPPTAVRVPRDHDSGQARGFAYVEFGTEAHIAAALALEQLELGGSALQLARSKPSAGGSRGGPRGGGRGGPRGGGRGGRGALEPHQHRRLAADGDRPDSAAAAPPPQQRSNADFRALLIGRGGPKP